MVVRAFTLSNTFWAVIIPEVISQNNGILIIKAFSAESIEYEEAERIDSAGNLTVLSGVTAGHGHGYAGHLAAARRATRRYPC
jgi:ABC-type glycerol-3-phosphate transport system permease component